MFAQTSILKKIVLALVVTFLGWLAAAPLFLDQAFGAQETAAWELVDQLPYELRDISMVSPADGWIVGYEFTAENGTQVGSVILHWDGTRWTRVTSPTTRPLYAVVMIAPDDGWAVGMLGTRLHWDGISWTDQSCSVSNCYNLYALGYAAADSVWAVGEFGYHYWNGATWEKSAVAPNEWYSSISVLSQSDVWVVGRYGSSYPYAMLVMHWNGSSWSKQYFNYCSFGLNAVDMLSTSNGWAVGAFSCVMRFTGVWNPVQNAITSPMMNDLDMLTPEEGWLVGGTNSILSESDGLILHWDGSSWSVVANPAQATLKKIDMLSANEGWAIGYEGLILRYTDFRRTYLPLMVR